MSTVTLTTLLTRVRERADMASSSFISDARLTDFVNEANQKLHGMLVDALGEEYVSSSSSFTTASGTADYALPSGFYKLYGVDLTVGGNIRPLSRFNRSERNPLRNTTLNVGLIPRYNLVGSNLRLYPVPTSVMTGAILYAPEATTLVSAEDQVTYPNGWERFIVLDAAIQCLLKEESSVGGLVEERGRIVQEIEATKENRDLASPKQVVDVDMVDILYTWQ
jgi:hypothetical protein